MHRWWEDLGRAERIVVAVTAFALLGAVVVVLLPFSSDDGLACGPPIVEWVGGGTAGAGVPGALDPGGVQPCVGEARRRLLGAFVWSVLAPIAGWVGLGVVRAESRGRG